MSETVTRPVRNVGIDLLRMVSMFLVVLLHVLGQGGVLANSSVNSSAWRLAWFLEICGYGCVDLYALISGYVGLRSRFRYTNIVMLWLRVVFYTLSITALFAVFSPESVTAETWLCAFFPVFKYQYWYFSAYFGMFFFLPCLNAAVRKLTGRQACALLAALAGIFSLLPAVLSWAGAGTKLGNVFGLSSGYSLLWLAMLYLAGACLRKYDLPEKIPAWCAWTAIPVCILVTWVFRINGNSFLVNYTSPTVVAASLALIVLFTRVRFARGAKIISFFSGLSFSVYLIHVHPLIWEQFMYRRFTDYVTLSLPLLALAVIGTALGIFVLCSIIDLLREGLFRLLHLKEGVARLERRWVGDLWNPEN